MDKAAASPPPRHPGDGPGSPTTPPGRAAPATAAAAAASDAHIPRLNGIPETPDNDLIPTHFTTTPPPPSSAPSSPQTPSTPPYWTRHARTTSYHSLNGPTGGGPIALEDHSADSHVAAQSCWAESATVDEYTVVSGAGGGSGIGAYVVWLCTVKTLLGGDLLIRKRYSDFARLHADLTRSFPHAAAMIPDLPRKSLVSRFRPEFLEARRRGLGHFLNCILLNPEFASSPVLKGFVFS